MNWAKNLQADLGSRVRGQDQGPAINGEIERIFINQCGPVLFGSKPSALFWVSTESCFACLLDLIGRIDRGASVFVLKNTKNGFLVLFYKPGPLNQAIMEPETQKLLCSFGYPQGKGPARPPEEAYLDILQTRILESSEFPHEIGLFLGYPSEDVAGFIEQKGKNYKYCGLWKVYGNVKKAVNLFQHYEECRNKGRTYIAAIKPGPAREQA
jgi:hypothetical protein